MITVLMQFLFKKNKFENFSVHAGFLIDPKPKELGIKKRYSARL